VPEIGIFLSSEELRPDVMVSAAREAEAAGFRSVWVSDHYHPWNDRQGQSPFVWSVIGGIAATTRMKVLTGVTAPIIRIHPAILAQAAATSQIMTGGRFWFGVGSGENLNEHILGDYWPPADQRLDMLEEAVEVMRKLWSGKLVSHRGTYYTVDNARIYSLPDEPPPVLISGFGPKATELAARIGDGYVNVSPERELPDLYTASGGKGPKVAGMKVCYGADEQACVKLAHELWANEGLPGQLAQELALPSFFEQASELVTEDMTAESTPCGPDPETHLAAIRQYLDAGYDEVYISQIGPDQKGFIDFFSRELRPRLGL
jgi:G6PDH family F420-dependent oxidoreductase